MKRPQFLNFTNKEILLSDLDFNYNNDVSALSTQIAFKNLNIHPESFDLKNSIIAIKDIELNNLNGLVKMGSKGDTKVVTLTTENGKKVPTEFMPWKFTIASIRLNDNSFLFR